jgi:transposase
VKLGARRRAVELLVRHPGWSDARVARELGDRYGLDASAESVRRWRHEELLAGRTKRVRARRRRPRLRVVTIGQALMRKERTRAT